MSSLALFAVGTGVTLLVVVALALLVWGAVMDGQYNREQHQVLEGAAIGELREPLPPVHALDAA
jgi:hypothetical protein